MLPVFAACRAGGHWNDKLWAEASLPFINIPRHSLSSSHFTLGSWSGWAFIWFKKKNSAIKKKKKKKKNSLITSQVT